MMFYLKSLGRRAMKNALWHLQGGERACKRKATMHVVCWDGYGMVQNRYCSIDWLTRLDKVLFDLRSRSRTHQRKTTMHVVPLIAVCVQSSTMRHDGRPTATCKETSSKQSCEVETVTWELP